MRVIKTLKKQTELALIGKLFRIHNNGYVVVKVDQLSELKDVKFYG